MSSRVTKWVVLFSLASVFAFSCPATAQQITYYNFDSSSGNYSYGCFDPAVDPTDAANNPLLCLNDITASAFGSGTNPSFQTVTYPANLGGGSHIDTLMNPAAGSHSETLWFSVPQKIANGFTSYFAFQLTPSGSSYATADGIAFVVQNAHGGGAMDVDTGCQELNNGNPSIAPFGPTSGPNVVTGGGGCIGYSGIDNSLAVEFDTYTNQWDPGGSNSGGNSNDTGANHIAVQNCGSGVNSSSHFGSSPCLVHDDTNNALTAINSALSLTVADGNVHEVVVEYNGALGTPANQLQIFVDPVFVAGTHTPAAGSVPVISVIYNLANHLSLLGGDSAYVGFSSATGAAFEGQELLAWTFTPHTPVTQPQPLQPAGSQTTFPFGSHTYAVTYPSSGPSTSGTDMVVIANTINPTDFVTLIAPTPYAGSQCQVYDGTGGNCVIYSVYCVTHGTTNKVACPATSDPTIAVKTAYESDNTVTPPSPGFLQGDPFFSPISSISGDGTTATVSCTGECAITVIPPATTQSVTIAGNSEVGFNGSVNATPTGIDTFTFPSPTSSSGTGGYVTSNNLSNICNGASDTPPCWQAAKIDGTTAGRTKNFSDLVALSTTVSTVNTTLSISAPPISYGSVAQVTVSVSPVSATGPVTGSVTLTVDGNSATAQTASLTNGSASFTLLNLTAGPHSLSASYAGTTGFAPSNTTTPTSLIVSQVMPVITWGTPAPITYGTALSGAQLNASANVAGTLAYNPPAMTVPHAGMQTLQVTFTPYDTTDYSSVSAQVSLIVNQATPVIMWTPASIQLGYPLTTAQLNASASALGTSFVYSPPVGTVVSTTSQTVSVIFTPMDATDYTAATKTVSLTVTPGPLAMVSPTTINFGNAIYLGSIIIKPVTLTNIGNAAMAVTGNLLSLVKGGDSKEFVEVNLCPKSLAVGKSCTMTIAFIAGPYYNLQTATLNVMDNAPGNPQTVALSATVINPQAKLSANSLNFGTQKLNTSSTKTITLTSSGNTPLLFNNISISGSTAFTETNNCPPTLSTSCTVTVKFAPSSKQSQSATLKINDNALSSPQAVALSGNCN
jgi:Legume lectin domain/Bacterial Ig-like domain (group 3)